MFNKIGTANLFVQIYNFGLLLLFAGIFKEYFFAPASAHYFCFGITAFFAAGASLCLISLIFLLAEWVIIPFGTQHKRRILYRGAGNLFALTMLGGAYLLIAEQSPLNLARVLPFLLGSGGILVASVVHFLGNPISERICRQKIKSKIITARSLPNRSAAENSNDNAGNARPLKIQKFLPEARQWFSAIVRN